MDFRILGRMELELDGQVIQPDGTMLRTLLATLLISNGQPVGKEELFEELWGASPPGNPDNALHKLVARLRRLLGNNGADSGRLLTRLPGYQLKVTPDEVDANRFQSLAARARTLRRTDLLRARDMFADALSLWRGHALEDVNPGQSCRAVASQLEESRLTAIADKLEVCLAAGLYAEVISELRTLTILHPWHEPFYHLLMTGLYRAGRQAEAIDAYHQLRACLREELGLEPSLATRGRLHAILKQDSSLLATSWEQGA
jgi:DNA-binding SARP family transcriptional activator